MGRIEKVVLWSVLALFLAWIVTPSSLFVRPVALSYNDGLFEFVRETPFGTVDGRWTQEIRSRLGECSHSDGSTYQDQGLEPVSYPPSEQLEPCVPTDDFFVVAVSRNVLLGGVIPLRASREEWTCLPDGTPCER